MMYEWLCVSARAAKSITFWAQGKASQMLFILQFTKREGTEKNERDKRENVPMKPCA